MALCVQIPWDEYVKLKPLFEEGYFQWEGGSAISELSGLSDELNVVISVSDLKALIGGQD